MYLLWHNIVLPLSLILLILFILSLIFLVFSIFESFVFSKMEEFKVRKTMRKKVKECCNELEKNIDDVFNNMIDIFMLGAAPDNETMESPDDDK